MNKSNNVEAELRKKILAEFCNATKLSTGQILHIRSYLMQCKESQLNDILESIKKYDANVVLYTCREQLGI